MKSKLLGVSLLLSLGFFNPLQSSNTQSVTLFGPEAFTRAAGAPATGIRSISAPNLSRILGGSWTLKLTNGEDKATRISSGSVVWNGGAVIRQSDFNKNVTEITGPVVLRTSNQLEVSLASQPNALVKVSVEGSVALPPAPTLNPVTTPTSEPTQTLTGQAEPSTTIEVSVNGAISSTTTDGTGAFSVTVALNEGENLISVKEIDPLGLVSPAVSTTIVLSTGPKAVIVGTVLNSQTEAPLADTEITSLENPGRVFSDADGRFRYELAEGGTYRVRIAKEGFTFAQREVSVELGQEATVGDIYLLVQDTQVTEIGAAGGIHQNSTGTIEVEIPAGAVAVPVPIQATQYEKERELPGELPDTSFFTYAANFEPDGTEFTSPVTIRVANSLGFAPGTNIPVGVWNQEKLKWEHGALATVTPDGRWAEYTITHFSPHDINLPRQIPGVVGFPDVIEAQNSENTSGQPVICVGSAVAKQNGELIQTYQLPTYQSLGTSRALEFYYDSSTIGADLPLVIHRGFDDFANNRAPNEVRATFQFGSQKKTVHYEGSNGTIRLGTTFSMTDSSGEPLASGVYSYSAAIEHGYDGAVFGSTSCFGCDVETATAVASSERSYFTTGLEGKLLVENNRDSAFGPGWRVSNVQRIYPATNGDVLLSEAGGGKLLFETKNKLETVAGNGTAGFSGDGLLATEASLANPTDIEYHPTTGELYVADNGNRRIRKVSPDGFITTIAGGGADPNTDDIPAVGAQLGNVTGIGFDLGGNLYLVEKDKLRIRRVSPDGLIRTIYQASCVGTCGLAPNEGIFDVAVDAAGNLYWSDENNHRIRRRDTAGVVSDFIRGRGPLFLYGDRALSRDIKLSFPRGLAFNHDGEFLFAHSASNVPFDGIWRLDGGNILRRVAGTFETLDYAGEGLTARQAHIADPSYVAEDAQGNVYFSEQDVGLRRVDTRGILRTVAGFPAGENVDAQGVAIGPDGGAVFADRTSATIRRVTSFAQGETRELASPAGEFSSLIQNADGTYTRSYKNGGEVRFNAEGLQTSSIDRNGNTTAFEYDAQDRLIRVTDPAGLITRLFYSGDKLSEVQDPAGRVTQFQYNADGDLIRIVNPAGEEVSYTYDAAHRMTASIDSAGRRVEYAYNDKGEATETRYPTGEARGLRAFLSEGVIADPDETLNPVAQVDNTPQQYTDGRGSITASVLDEEGLETKVTDPLARATNITRNNDHLPTAIVRPDASRLDMTYDGRGNLTRLQVFGGGLSSGTNFSYEPVFNQVTNIRDPNNRETRFGYDASGNLTQITNALNQVTRAAYSAQGLVTSITDALGNTTTFTYDSKGNPASTTDPLGNTTTFSYDSAGNVTQITDAKGNATFFAYDAQNRLTHAQDANGGVTQYSYEQSGCGCAGRDLLTSITDAEGNITRFEYDDVGNLARVTDPSGKVETRNYDLNRNLASLTDRSGNTINYTYDAADQLTTVTKPEETVTFAYNVLGSITSAVNTATSLSLSYDGLNRLRTVASSHVAGSGVTYTYDAAGNVTQVSGPHGTILTSRDNLNRVSSVQVGTGFTFDRFSIGYDTAGRRTSNSHQLTNLNELRSYDAASRLLRKINQRGSGGAAVVASRFDYSYDAVGNRTSQQDGFGTHNFSYDAVYRLLGVDDPAETFSYDDVGNRLSSVDAGSNFTHIYNASNQLISMTKDGAPYADFSYDSNGNLVSKTVEGATTTYTWDSENRLTGVTTPTQTIAYEYDPFGRRIEKTVGASVTRYVYDREDIVAEYDGAGALQATYIHGPGIDEPLQMKRGGVTYFYQRDGLDSIVGLANASGTVVRSYRYDSFGRIVTETGSLENPYVYTGRERDSETGLYYYRARYYDPQLGRFISEDPIGFSGGNNFYSYVRNNPINRSDPFGLINILFGGGGISAVAGTVGVEASAGYVFNPGLFGQQADFGVFGSVGTGGGVNVSADIFAGIVFGGIENVSGVTNNINIIFGLLSVTTLLEPGSGKLMGFTVGLGPSVSLIGASGTLSFTGTVTNRDLLNVFFGEKQAGLCPSDFGHIAGIISAIEMDAPSTGIPLPGPGPTTGN